VNGLAIALVAGGAALLLAAVLVVVVMTLRGAAITRGIEIAVLDEDGIHLAITTPLGSGRARLVVHDDLGKVYEVRTTLRGEGSKVEYVPPAIHLVRTNLERRLAALGVAS
jgi:hypothetical protein